MTKEKVTEGTTCNEEEILVPAASETPLILDQFLPTQELLTQTFACRKLSQKT